VLEERKSRGFERRPHGPVPLLFGVRPVFWSC